MQHYDEHNKEINTKALAKEIEADESSAPSTEELEQDLASHYHAALRTELKSFSLESASVNKIMAASPEAFLGIGKGILEKIRKIVCKIINGSSTTQDIIDAVMDALASILPGGAIIKAILKKIVKYILTLGIGRFCPTP